MTARFTAGGQGAPMWNRVRSAGSSGRSGSRTIRPIIVGTA